MRSPVDTKSVLQTETLEDELTVMRCPASAGVWLRPGAYWKWRERHEAATIETGRDGSDLELHDSPAGKRCPEDGYFLIRHRVGHGLDFHVDRCGHCGGMWLDANEWQALRCAGLHDKLHLVFTSAWQAENRARDRRDSLERLLRDKLDDDDLRHIQEIRAWIDSHERRHELMAYLRGEWD